MQRNSGLVCSHYENEQDVGAGLHDPPLRIRPAYNFPTLQDND